MQLTGICKNGIKQMSKKGPETVATGELYKVLERRLSSLASILSHRLCAHENNARFEGKRKEINIY